MLRIPVTDVGRVLAVIKHGSHDQSSHGRRGGGVHESSPTLARFAEENGIDLAALHELNAAPERDDKALAPVIEKAEALRDAKAEAFADLVYATDGLNGDVRGTARQLETGELKNPALEKAFQEQQDSYELFLQAQYGWEDEHFSLNGKPAGSFMWRESSRGAMTPATSAARDVWVVDDAKTLSMQRGLRTRATPSQRALTVDTFVETGKCEKDAVLYRSALLPESLHGQLTVGTTFTDKGFMASSPARSMAENYARIRRDDGGKGDVVIWRLSVPKGSTVANAYWDEYVIKRGSTLTVTGRNTEGNGTIVIDATVDTHE